MKFCPNVSVPSRGYLFLNRVCQQGDGAGGAVSVPSRGYLFLNRRSHGEYEHERNVSVPSRGYLFLNVSDRKRAQGYILESFRPLSGVSLPQQDLNIWKMLLTLVSVPSRGYLFLNT